MNPADTDLAEDLRVQLQESWERQRPFLPHLAPRSVPARRAPSRSRWAAAGVFATAGATAVAAVLATGAGHRTSGAVTAAKTPPVTADDRAMLAKTSWFSFSVQITHPGGESAVPSASGSARFEPAGTYRSWNSHHGTSYSQSPNGAVSTDVSLALGGHGATWDEFVALPSDPAKLAPLVAVPGGRFFGALDVLRYDPAPLDVRRALVQLMEAQNGVTTVTEVPDSRGLPTTRLTLDGPDQTLNVYVDPTTFRPTETTSVAGPTYKAAPAGTVLEQVNYLSWTYDPPPQSVIAAAAHG